MSPLHPHRIRISLLALPTLRFFHLSTSILNFSLRGRTLPPTSPLHQHHIRILLHALPTLRFFPPVYLHFTFFLKLRSLTSKVTPTLTSDSDSPPSATYPSIFIHLSTSILTFSRCVGALPPTPPLRKH